MLWLASQLHSSFDVILTSSFFLILFILFPSPLVLADPSGLAAIDISVYIFELIVMKLNV